MLLMYGFLIIVDMFLCVILFFRNTDVRMVSLNLMSLLTSFFTFLYLYAWGFRI